MRDTLITFPLAFVFYSLLLTSFEPHLIDGNSVSVSCEAVWNERKRIWRRFGLQGMTKSKSAYVERYTISKVMGDNDRPTDRSENLTLRDFYFPLLVKRNNKDSTVEGLACIILNSSINFSYSQALIVSFGKNKNIVYKYRTVYLQVKVKQTRSFENSHNCTCALSISTRNRQVTTKV